ncbi:YceI family protein [Paraglaciecola aestuariivivens]
MKTILSKFIFCFALCFSLAAQAQWTLSEEQSSVHFVTTKNQHISELMHFKQLQGQVSQKGEFTLTIALASIDSGIEIRDTRMRDKLFVVNSFPHAQVTATLPQTVTQLKQGQTLAIKVPANLTLLTQTKPIEVWVQVSHTLSGELVASSIQPILIQASDFGLVEGIKALQALAGLNSIGQTVPVNFNLVFNPK